MPLRLRAGAASETGPHRANNEDAAFTASSASAVADGVGGGPAGELASASLVHRIAAMGVAPSTLEALRSLIRVSNWELSWHSRRDPAVAGMATTLTALFAGRDEVFLAHVGDSRGYRLRAGSLARLTRDDSYVQALVDAGLIDPVEAVAHPQRNVVTASLRGASSDADAVTLTAFDAEPGERWLLCSDGVSDYLPEDLLGELLSADDDPVAAARRIVDTALEAGSRDNVTAVVCDVTEHNPDDPSSPVYYGAAADHFTESLEDTA